MYIRWSVLILTIFCTTAFAVPQAVTIKMVQMEALKTSERSGDELYFGIIQYSNQANPSIFREPMFPMYWKSKDLYRLRDVVLWQGTVQDHESVLLIISLLEQDLPPWDPDDHIGSVQVKFVNSDGKLDIVWDQPSFKDQPKVVQDKRQSIYTMYGEDSEYKVQFKVEVNDLLGS